VSDLSLKVDRCDLAGGFSKQRGQADKGYLAVNCSIDVQWPKYQPNGSFRTFYDANVRLGLPDGSEIGPIVSEGLTLGDRTPRARFR
jgi:hypothetical protein